MADTRSTSSTSLESKSRAIGLSLVSPAASLKDPKEHTSSTLLAHWGPIRRGIHYLCKRSRLLNTIVAAIEMRLGREEVLSLPQFMGLCPTGQCNALCEFCSVTKNRTGIIKKQLPFDRLREYTRHVSRTIRMYGLEGNGEPTLYDHFNDLVESLTADGATFYLITNGEKLTTAQIDMMLNRDIDAVNFSLNSVSADTHRRVMKLKHFDVVVSNIRRFIECRKGPKKPWVSASFVVTRDNIHEVQDFLHFGEQELKLDRLLIRPLSELANDRGSVQDERDLVPYESEIADILQAVDEYLQDYPRTTEIVIDPKTFRSYRANPPDRLILPRGFEERLLPPRRSGWTIVGNLVTAAWRRNSVELSCPSHASSGVIMRSCSIPVQLHAERDFRCAVRLARGGLMFSVLDDAGQVLGSQHISATLEIQNIAIRLEASPRKCVRLALAHDGGDLKANIDFERLHTPGHALDGTFELPHARRWEVNSPGVRFSWEGNRLHLLWNGAPGPYLLKSYSIPCVPARRHDLPVRIDVRSGSLGIVFLNSDGRTCSQVFQFATGVHSTNLLVETGTNTELRVVLYSCEQTSLDVEIDWQHCLSELPKHETMTLTGPTNVSSVEHERKPPAETDRSNASKPLTLDGKNVPRCTRQNADRGKPSLRCRRPFSGYLRIVVTYFISIVLCPIALLVWLSIKMLPAPSRKKARFYCQKPWTDLNNFTVDGRMDVCCIATGSSQVKYALGNIFEQDFQQVWNGKVMREFRKTVNGDDPLPPCKRCPMAYAYQGLFFDLADTMGAFHSKIDCHFSALPGFARSAAKRLVDDLCEKIIFRGFERKAKTHS